MGLDDEETDSGNSVTALRSQFEQLTGSVRQKDVTLPPSRQSSATLLGDRDAATTSASSTLTSTLTSTAPPKPVKPAALKSPATSRPSSPAILQGHSLETEQNATDRSTTIRASADLPVAIGNADAAVTASTTCVTDSGFATQKHSKSSTKRSISPQNSKAIPPSIPQDPRPSFLEAPITVEPQLDACTGSPFQKSRTPPPVPASRTPRNLAAADSRVETIVAIEAPDFDGIISAPPSQLSETACNLVPAERVPPAVLRHGPGPPKQAPPLPSSVRPTGRDLSAKLPSENGVPSVQPSSRLHFDCEDVARAKELAFHDNEADTTRIEHPRPRSLSAVAPPLPVRNQTPAPPSAAIKRSGGTANSMAGSFPVKTEGTSSCDHSLLPSSIPHADRSKADVSAFVPSQISSTPVKSKTDDSDDEEQQDEEGLRRASELPDATFANKRPPVTRPNRKIYLQQPAQAFAICGRFAVTVTSMIRVWEAYSGATLAIIDIPGERKITEVAFVSCSSESPIIWVGAKDGSLYEIDIVAKRILNSKAGAHSHPISRIQLLPGSDIVTIDESGKVQIWPADGPNQTPLLKSTPTTQRLADRANFLHIDGWHLWALSGPHRHHTGTQARSPAIRIFNLQPDHAFSTTAKPAYLPETGAEVGAVLASATIPSNPDILYMAHDSGHVSLWSKSTQVCTQILKISQYAVTSLCGVLNHLWAGNREGTVYVYDTRESPWAVVKVWKAAEETVLDIRVDASTLKDRKLHVATFSRQNITYWDGFFEMDWMEQRMLKREAEFCQYRNIKIMICSWNIDACKPADLQGCDDNCQFLRDVVRQGLTVAAEASDPPEVLVFGLQEVIDLEDRKLTAKTVLFGRKKVDQKFQDGVSHQYQRWHDHLGQAVRAYMPPGTPYSVIITESMVGLLSCIFVRSSERERLRDVTSLLVKTGMGGRYGNKGGILGRFVMDDSSICFVNCHLAAGQRAKRQRGKDLIDILENKSAFLQPSNATSGVYINGPGYTVFEHEICFLSGDLNYRIDLPRSVVAANIRSNNLSLLLEHDQLQKELKTNHAFRLRSFREVDLKFPPTYKFDPGTNDYDSSAKERIPAWCDRILFRTHDPATNGEKVTPLSYRSWPANPSDHKPVSGLFAVKTKTIVHERRSKVLQECQEAWLLRQTSLLTEADKYHVK